MAGASGQQGPWRARHELDRMPSASHAPCVRSYVVAHTGRLRDGVGFQLGLSDLTSVDALCCVYGMSAWCTASRTYSPPFSPSDRSLHDRVIGGPRSCD